MIDIRGVTKAFGPKVIYTGLDLNVEEGETHAIIGRSGEGKSVLLKMICGLLHPDQGTVSVDGVPVDTANKASIRHIRERVTMVFQMGALFDSLTVRENIGFYHDNHKTLKPAEIDTLVEELLHDVNLPNTGHLLPSELSGGMRKRVGLARALAVKPKILLYDEPTTGLDPVTTDVIGELIRDTNRKYRVTSVVVTHDMNSAYKVADRISMLYNGRIIFTGSPHQVRTTDDPVVHQFINGLAHGPITQTEEEGMQRLSTQMIDRSVVMRRIHHESEELDRE